MENQMLLCDKDFRIRVFMLRTTQRFTVKGVYVENNTNIYD